MLVWTQCFFRFQRPMLAPRVRAVNSDMTEIAEILPATELASGRNDMASLTLRVTDLVARSNNISLQRIRSASPPPPPLSRQPRKMRYLVLAFVTFLLAACSTAPATRRGSQAVSPTPVRDPERQGASIDSVVQFLLTAAATDFHTHRPPDPLRFREVRIGHVMAPTGDKQYMLCGEFQPAQEVGRAEWTPFATIKTSGYEQWIGAQAAGFCQGSSVIWDKGGDLSASLQSRLDSLR